MATHHYVGNEANSSGPSEGQGAASQMDRPVPVLRIRARATGRWLLEAVTDIHASHYRSLLYGLFFVLMGLGIMRAHEGNAAFALGLSAAFVFTGPFLSMGLYELSRQVHDGEKPDLLLSLFSWCRNPGAAGRFAFYLSVVMVVWLWLSTVLIETWFLRTSEVLFFVTVLLWAALAISVFVASAVAIPMMLDRPVSAVQAVNASLRCFRVNTQALCLWACIVGCSVGLSLVLGYWPLLLVGPLLGHATWHAYRDMQGLAGGQEGVADPGKL